MKKVSAALVTSLLLCAPIGAQTVFNPEKGEASPVSEPVLGCNAITDDGYDGTMASMTCMAVPVTAGTVADVSLELGIVHTWAGDLVVKVFSPMGTELTLMSRPGFDEPADDGTGCCGDSANFVQSSPIFFGDGEPTSAEDAGASDPSSDAVICQDDGSSPLPPSCM